ncbi:MAG: hypothetical protein ACRD3J_31800 [Thermoanaerobaculia bacterium]
MRLTLLLILLSTFIVTTNGRSILDPIGGPPGVTADSGGGMDPNGGATTDAGSAMDPNGLRY